MDERSVWDVYCGMCVGCYIPIVSIYIYNNNNVPKRHSAAAARILYFSLLKFTKI